MKANELIVRCFAERVDHQWQAFCLDFDLGAQADSMADVKVKLESMIVEYIKDALVGPDKEFASQFLRRRAPLRLWARFYIICAQVRLHRIREGIAQSYEQAVPLQPAAC